MVINNKYIPEDIDSLKEAIIELAKINADLQSKNIDLQSTVDNQEEHIEFLNHQMKLLADRLYGKKSEKIDLSPYRPIPIFANDDSDDEPPQKPETIAIGPHQRRKSGRKPLPECLPRREIIHEIPEEERRCACGCIKEKIGEEVTERLDYIPAKIEVERHIRIKYACKNCEGADANEDDPGTVQTAPLPPQIIPQGIATPSLIAYILISKFCDALPLYRLEGIFGRIGVEISRQTMSNWITRIFQRCQKALDFFMEKIRSGPLIGIDETTVQVLNEPGRKNTTKSYMWVFRGGTPKNIVVLYGYFTTRHVDKACSFLKDYEGFVQTDGFSGYRSFFNNGKSILIGCWAHVRRKFVEALKIRKKNKKASPANHALEEIRELYAIEEHARKHELDFDAIHALRQEKALPILERFHEWLLKNKDLTPPQSVLGHSIQYTLNQWELLTNYLLAGFIPIDNNLVENTVRPFAVGRKNWLFSGDPLGAAASAFFYSMIETAKARGLNPNRYIRFFLEWLPYTQSDEDLLALMPWMVKPEDLDILPPKHGGCPPFGVIDISPV